MGSDFSSILLPPIAAMVMAMVGWGAALCTLSLLRRVHKKRAPTQPDTDTAPAQALCMEQAVFKTQAALALVVVTPIAFVAALFFQPILKIAQTAAPIHYPAFGLIGGALWGYALYRWLQAARRHRDMQWRLEAKALVDKAVAPLMRRGYRLFRDFAVDNMAIDYLLVGPKGVFVLQVLIRSKGTAKNPAMGGTVTYDGRTLFFSDDKDFQSLEAAETQANELSEWLCKELDIPVAARAILALPGWQIKRISAEGISVINPSQLEALFQYMKPRPLSANEVRAIVCQIEPYDTSAGIKDGTSAISESINL
ncbi:MAG: NERD domain-containing protein [Desulfatitalea sp.]|nr:NERD domain-containing protein [Desulfatitalea sp.]